MPELRQLRVFVAVAEELNFTRAGERLFLGQQAVSKSVRQLERELGVVLLERTTHEVRLTAAGEALLREGREALLATDAAFERARRVINATAGTLHIGVSPALGPGERDALVHVVRDGAPELSVALRELRPEEAPEALRRRTVEFAVARTATVPPDIALAELAPTPACLYVPAHHRLAARNTPVEIRELDGERLLTWNSPGTPLTDLLLARLAADGAHVIPVEARISGMTTSLADLVDLEAVAIASAAWQRDERVVELPFTDEVSLPLVVLWAAGARPAAVDRIRRSMTSVAVRSSR
jgi:DNA-binding transcriptional LysR family regulator